MKNPSLQHLTYLISNILYLMDDDDGLLSKFLMQILNRLIQFKMSSSSCLYGLDTIKLCEISERWYFSDIFVNRTQTEDDEIHGR